VLENVGRGSPKTAGDSSQQIQVDRLLGAPKSYVSIGDVLRSYRKALHGDEILATDDAKSVSAEGHVDGTREGLRIEPSQAAQEIDPIAVSIADDEHRRNAVIRVPATQVCLKARLLEARTQACKLGSGYEDQCISVGRCA